MKSKVLVIFTAVLLFGVGFAVYAYNSTTTSAETVSASCCSCCGDSCPMKSTGTKAADESGHECCCKGGADSCPMKSKDAKVAVSSDDKDSCPMMSEKHEGMAGHDMKMSDGRSCPMMKDGKKADMHINAGHSADTTSCCCSPCNHSKENRVTSAL